MLGVAGLEPSLYAALQPDRCLVILQFRLGDTAARLKTSQQSLGRGLPLRLGKWKLDEH